MLVRRLGSRRGRPWATAGVLVLALGAWSCGQLNTNGRSPSYLVIDTLQAASGADPGTFSSTLESDVVTNVAVTVGSQQVVQPTTYEDPGVVKLRAVLKDQGTATAVTTPTEANAVTVTRYHVAFSRSDGRKTEGVDVPYAFDGAATGTIGSDGGTLNFVLVRSQAKLEAPLRALRDGGGAIVISTIATITFYGKDQNGNEVSVTGSMSVNFADWGDPS